MTDPRFKHAAATARCAAALFLGLGATSAGAGSLHLEASPCASRIVVKADDVPLDDIVRRIADALEVRLEARQGLPERVTFNGVGSPEDVLQRLLRGRNLVLDSNPSQRCEGREVLTTVWLLPTGQEVTRGAKAPPAPVIQQPGDVRFVDRPPAPRGTRKRMSDEEWRRAKDDYKAGRTQADPETGLPIPADKPAGEAR